MKKKFLDFTIAFIQKYKNYENADLEKLQYGLEGLYLSLTKILVILIISIILGIWKQVIFVLVFFNIIRYTGFGFHAAKSYQCLILSILYFLVIPEIYIHVPFSHLVQCIICGICIFCFILFAPADTVKRPLPNRKKRIIRKIVTVLIGVIYSLVIVLFPNSYMTPVLLSALTIQAFVIQPLLYKLFGQPYNNYKTYQRV